MRVVLSLALVAALSSSLLVLADEEIKTDEGVLVLTKGNYQKAVDTYAFLLVEFCKLV